MVVRSIQNFSIFVAGLLLAEGMLQIASLAIPRIDALLSFGIPLRIPDALLGYRPNPALADQDARGWRNPEALDRAEIVTLGDSQTYGDEVARQNAWPLVLGALLDTPTYNMASSGYGPVQYLLSADEAISLNPKLLLVGVYAGNDFANAYDSRGNREFAPGLDAGAPHGNDYYIALDAQRGSLSTPWQETQAARFSPVEQIWRRHQLVFEKNSKLYALISGLSRIGGASGSQLQGDAKRTKFDKYAKRLSGVSTDLYFPFRVGEVATILTPSSRRGVVDIHDPRVVEGFRLTVRVLEEIQHKCGDHCQVVSVFIPTKEYAFKEVVLASASEIPLPYRELVRFEHDIWQKFGDELDERDIVWINTTESLRDAIRDGRNPYLSNWNGHPNAIGNEVIAQAVAQHSIIQLLDH